MIIFHNFVCVYLIHSFSIIFIFYRFLYGKVKDFKSINFAVKLYEFSQEMQINSLKLALEEFFNKAEISDLIALFDIFVTTGNQEGLNISKSVRKSYNFIGGIILYVCNFKANLQAEIKRSL